jgi:LysR family hydrogen peroxide-inducible transcriptional activator
MTDVGAAVAQQARIILAEVKAVKEIVQSFDDPMAGELHVGLIPTLAPYLLPRIMPGIRAQYPKLKLWLHEYQTSVLLEQLRRAELDFLILALPVDTDEFTEIHLFNEPFQLAVPKDEELAQQPMIALAELSKREMLLLEEGHCLRGQALDVCFMAGATENVGFHASSLETLRQMVAEGMGITLMPELAIPSRQSETDTIRYLPFTDPRPSRQIGMLYRKGSYRKETFIKLQLLIQNEMDEKENGTENNYPFS